VAYLLIMRLIDDGSECNFGESLQGLSFSDGTSCASSAWKCSSSTLPPCRFPLIVETLARLRSGSCIIDGEAVACDDNGVASFDIVRHQRVINGVHNLTAPSELSIATAMSPPIFLSYSTIRAAR
jgi:hypothetical protein